MRLLHCTSALLVSLAVALPLSIATAHQLPPVAPTLPEPTASPFTIFVGGVPVGSEQVGVSRSADGWTITGSGRIGAPLDIVTRRLQIRYDANWKPIELTIDATVRGQLLAVRSVVSGGTITNQIRDGDQSTTTTATTDAELLLSNPFFASYEALAARLKTTSAGTKIPAYEAPQLPFSIRVGDWSPNRIQTLTQLIDARRTHVTFVPIGAPPMEVDIWADQAGRLLRVSIPEQSLEVVREDIASVAARDVPVWRPNDEQVKIPSSGFSLVGTISKPADAGSKPLPAVVFIGGSGRADRDGPMFGVPILGQLADAVADAGFITLRYDKRGVGQSGGRFESASVTDLAEDLRTAVKLLSDRKDVDPKRIAAVGHSEGGAVVLGAAAKDRRIAAVALVASNGVRGAELILEQQQRLLTRLNLSESEKQARVELQKRVNEAVITGRGWETLPLEARRQSDNAEFQSLLTSDPAKTIPDVRQPMLIVHGELDTQISPVNADRLGALARKRKNSPPVEVVKVSGVNHLLVPATTGEVEEYATLEDKHVSRAVSGALVTWLQKTLSAK